MSKIEETLIKEFESVSFHHEKRLENLLTREFKDNANEFIEKLKHLNNEYREILNKEKVYNYEFGTYLAYGSIPFLPIGFLSYYSPVFLPLSIAGMTTYFGALISLRSRKVKRNIKELIKVYDDKMYNLYNDIVREVRRYRGDLPYSQSTKIKVVNHLLDLAFTSEDIDDS